MGNKWDEILLAFKKWVEEKHPDFPFMEDLTRQKPRPENDTNNIQHPSSSTSIHSWQKTDGRIYGSLLNFRGLQHAPINEQGVVFLFGMVAQELGFIVESVASGYPDCEAKRCVDKNQNYWQKARIEFEYQSRNFRDHSHDPHGCDLIICWENNWPECPIEVLELRKEIPKLSSYKP